MSGNSTSLRTMIVDDDRIVRKILAQMLADDGFIVQQAASADECLNIATSAPADAFLIDLHLPELDGIEICRQLRRLDSYRQVPIIIITADRNDEALARAFEAGADDFIVKPVMQKVLQARLGAHLERVHYQRNLSRYVSGRTQKAAEYLSRTGRLMAPARREVCVLFSDVRGFTQLSSALDADMLFDLLSENLGAQVDIVYANGGYVDKYAGDGIMAVFDAENRFAAACRSALAIIATTRAERGRHNLPDLQIGIGIHAGSVLVGNIGSATHLDYSAIGQTVNLAARLCGCAEPMSVVISDAVASQVRSVADLQFSDPQAREIRGINEVLWTYTLGEAPVRASEGTKRRDYTAGAVIQ